MKVIIYIDMDAFFTSCHEAENNALQGKPIVVATNSLRAIVASASYQARKCGIKTPMPLYQAKMLCSKIMQVTPNKKLYYYYYSNQIYQLLITFFTNKIAICSVDEFCLDVTSIYHRYGSAFNCALKIQQQICEKLNLTCSIGISYNKLFAKIAAEIKKPGGIFIIKPSFLQTIIWALNLSKIPGMGPKTIKQLNLLQVTTVADFINHKNQWQLQNMMKKRYDYYHKYFTGNEFNDMTSTRLTKSVGCDFTFEYNTADFKTINTTITKIAKTVSYRADNQALVGCIIVFALKNKDHKWISKQIKLRWYTNRDEIISVYGQYLLQQLWNKQPIRSLRLSLKQMIKVQEILNPITLYD